MTEIKGTAEWVYLKEIETMDIRDRIARAKYFEEGEIDKIDLITADIAVNMDELIGKGGVLDA